MNDMNETPKETSGSRNTRLLFLVMNFFGNAVVLLGVAQYGQHALATPLIVSGGLVTGACLLLLSRKNTADSSVDPP